MIIAGALILRYLAYGSIPKKQKKDSVTASVFESIGALLFIGVALFGLLVAGTFFVNFIPKGTPFYLVSAGIIPICNIAISMKVGAGLFSIFIALAAIKHVTEE